MDKLFPTAGFLLVVLLFASGTLKMKLVEGGNKCLEGLGPCSSDCDQKCKSRHPSVSSSGSCDYMLKPPTCTCYYSCGEPDPTPPHPKRNCRASGGQCSAGCNTPCCNANCAAKYNSGQGYCDNSSGVDLCQCQFVC